MCGAASCRINCQDSPILSFNHHIAEIYLNYCALGGDPLYITGASGKVALRFLHMVGGRNQSYLMFFHNELSPCKFIGEIINYVGGQVITVFSLRLTVLLNRKGRFKYIYIVGKERAAAK